MPRYIDISNLALVFIYMFNYMYSALSVIFPTLIQLHVIISSAITYWIEACRAFNSQAACQANASLLEFEAGCQAAVPPLISQAAC